MPLGDLFGLVLEALRTQRLRSALTMLGFVIGIASVVLLSAIGEGTREGVLTQFASFGTTLVQVTPGRQTTFGAGPAAMGTTRPITVEDALALARVPAVRYVAPHVVGMGEVRAEERTRRTYVYGTVAEDRHCLKWEPRIGTFLPEGDPDRIPPVCVLGAKVAKELFPGANPLGSRVRVGEVRFTVTGVMESKGQMLGFDLDDMVFIPLRRAMRMFNRDDIPEVHVYVASHAAIDAAVREVRRVLEERHDGEEDFTITSQADMLSVVGEVMDVLTAGVLVIAAISVVVGAIGILTIMWVSVHERTREIGLWKALGASDRQVRLVFLAEAAALSVAGGAGGIGIGAATGALIEAALPAIRVEVPAWTIPVSLAVSLAAGLLAGVAPAARAARLDPIEALRAE
jgi:putative ABC transport system permease protein